MEMCSELAFPNKLKAIKHTFPWQGGKSNQRGRSFKLYDTKKLVNLCQKKNDTEIS